MKKSYFISGTDTGVGKTAATGWLARKFAEGGLSVITQKLIQTGCSGISEDIIEHRKIMGIDITPEDADGTTCKHVLSFPASPHLAIELDKADVDFDSLAENTKKLLSKYDVVLVEGAGGLMVPLSRDYLTVDYIKGHSIPLILVVPSRLGSLNHALLSLELVKSRSIELAAIVYNTYPKESSQIEDSTRKYLREILARDFPMAEFFEMGKIEI